ncbi:MAG: M23 family metallopeptidase, partial [Desulfobacterales bacterium]|nr:M23 family metallopeptidase [Desulfobacterales bacterium]
SSISGKGKVQEDTFRVKVEPKKMGITDGKAILRIVVRDYSWRQWGHGNKAYVEKDVTVDTKRPLIDVMSKTHNMKQGGTGLIIYRVSEPCKKTGVQVGDNYFPSYSAQKVITYDKNMYLAFIALSHKQGPETVISVKATDYAGNETVGRDFSYYIGKSKFKKDTLRISDRFLNRILPEFDSEIQRDSNTTMKENFLLVNRGLRSTNYKKFVELAKNSDDSLHWEGGFQRFRGKPMAGFAEYRNYKYKNEIIDNQVHLGVDIASVARSPVPAANKGKVVFSEAIGIYGKTVMIDHGFGLFSTYSHLSSLRVKQGEMVPKGHIIGRTGQSGLAGGDHLHFGIFIHNTFVNPVEWWDSRWIKNNISDKINELK